MENIYESTRDPKQNATSKQAILNGIAPDGGLYVWPAIDTVDLDLNAIVEQSYIENAQYILEKILPDYTKRSWKHASTMRTTSPLPPTRSRLSKKVGDLYVLELFHGPTSAFKDVALTLLPQLMSTALKSAGKKALILTATSGDTGKAAMSGFKDVDHIGIRVFYPYEKVSQIQYRQMATQEGNNVGVYAIEGILTTPKAKSNSSSSIKSFIKSGRTRCASHQRQFDQCRTPRSSDRILFRRL